MTVSYKTIKVLVEEEYLVPMINEERSAINGWTIEDVKKAWFKDFDINRYHATRDTSRVSNGRTIIAIDGEKIND